MATRNITGDQFEDTVKDNDIVLFDFWADWCRPCKTFGPVFEESSEKHSDLVYAKIDTEAEQALAVKLGIQGIPMLKVFKNGVLVFDQAGALSPAQLEDLVQQVRALDVEAALAAQKAQSDSQQG